MRVLLVIDHFGSGGAQRQIVELACGLARRGHMVEVFVYFPQFDFFRARLEAQRIVVHEAAKGHTGSIGVIAALARVLRRGAYDVVASYQNSANIFAELAHLVAPRTRLVVSERTSYHDDRSPTGAWMRRRLHSRADRVVANSETQSAWLRGHSWLRDKVSCIYNGVDLQQFQPGLASGPPGRRLRLLGVGRIGPEKNLLNLIAALRHLAASCGYAPEVGWAGQRDASVAGRAYCEQVDALLARAPSVATRWRWLGVRTDIPELMRGYHALVHPSLYEGLPNAICEALASGMPVLASNVCDHPRLLGEGVRGLLFEPTDPASIAAAIDTLSGLNAQAWQALGRQGRAYAVTALGIDTMVDGYESLFATLLRPRGASDPDPGRRHA